METPPTCGVHADALDPALVRPAFPGLEREVCGRPAVFFDGPAGSQVPRVVADAVSAYLLGTNGNEGGPTATSRASDEVVGEARRRCAVLLGAPDPDCIAFGSNMTTLTLALSRAVARTWEAGDEVIVTRQEHDANVTPWVLAARDAGASVRWWDVEGREGTLDPARLDELLSPKTRMVAFGYASNLTGTVQPVADIARRVRAAGALTFVDAVHYVPHGPIDVEALGIDLLSASAYKFFGPHLGLLWGRRALLEDLEPYKLRPSSDHLPARWQTGTPNLEGIAGLGAAIGYLASLSGRPEVTRENLLEAFERIATHESQLLERLLAGLAELPGLELWGVANHVRLDRRVPTVSFTHPSLTPGELATLLAERGIFTRAGNHYALPLTEALGLEPGGTLRVGLLHYNTAEEVERLLKELHTLLVPETG